MRALYPTSLAAIRSWASENNVAENEARLRFAQYGVLWGIAGSQSLRNMLVFKGGNALDFVWQPNRSTRDLDFSADMALVGIDFDAATLGQRFQQLLRQALASSGRDLGVTYSVYKVEQQPPGPNRTFITYKVRISYALQDEPTLLKRMAAGEIIPRLIPVDISLNEAICADARVGLGEGHHLRVSTIEDIVAEKLRALLQQHRELRSRLRRVDVLDIAVILRANPQIHLVRVGEFLLTKAATRNVPVSRAAFREPEIVERARENYAALEATTRETFIPFDEAMAELLAFVDVLDIPE